MFGTSEGLKIRVPKTEDVMALRKLFDAVL